MKENQVKYISILEASRNCDYSQEYLSLRARQGKLKSKKIGRNWYTTSEWLNEYLNENGKSSARISDSDISDKKINFKIDFVFAKFTDTAAKIILAPFYFLSASVQIISKEIFFSFKKVLKLVLSALMEILLNGLRALFNLILFLSGELKKIAGIFYNPLVFENFESRFKFFNSFKNKIVKFLNKEFFKEEKYFLNFSRQIKTAAVLIFVLFFFNGIAAESIQKVKPFLFDGKDIVYNTALNLPSSFNDVLSRPFLSVKRQLEGLNSLEEYKISFRNIKDNFSEFYDYNYKEKFVSAAVKIFDKGNTYSAGVFNFLKQKITETKDDAAYFSSALKGGVNNIFKKIGNIRDRILGVDELKNNYQNYQKNTENVINTKPETDLPDTIPDTAKEDSTKKNQPEKINFAAAEKTENKENDSSLRRIYNEIKKLKSKDIKIENPNFKIILAKISDLENKKTLTKEELDTELNEINSKFLSQVNDLKNQLADKTQANFNAIALSNRINSLYQPVINSPTISSPVISGASVSGNASLEILTTSGLATLNTLSVSGSANINSTLAVTATTTFLGDLRADTNTLVVDVLNNRVGIGTTSPKYMLDIDGTLNAVAVLVNGANISGNASSTGSLTLGDSQDDILYLYPGAVKYFNSATTTLANGFVNAFSIATSSSNTPIFTIDTKNGNIGRIGIGTTSPAHLFEVGGDSYFGGNSTTTGRMSIFYSPQSAGQSNVFDSALYINSNGAVPDANMLGIADNGAWKFRVDKEGDIFTVGNLTTIGTVQQATTSVTGNFTVEGWTLLGDAPNNDYTEIRGYGLIRATSTNAALSVYQGSTGQIFDAYDENTKVFTILDGGNTGIGTTTPNWLLQANGTRPFFTLSDSSAGTNLRHWFMSSQGGNLYVGTSSDAYSTSTISALTILSNSNIGVGTTSPFAKFSVSGNLAADNLTITATNATSTFNGGLLGAAGGGVIGFGTTTPSTFFSVAGHCVTGDTRLRRRRRKKKANGEYEYEYDEVQIKNIKPGDEILTLNEKTGKLEYRGVRSLLDMGIMPIYKLITASGKTIRTTGNHPYLAEIKPDGPKQKLFRFEIDQSIRIEELNKDTIIALANNENSFVAVIPRKLKRSLNEIFRKQGEPKKFAPAIFASAITVILTKFNFKFNEIIIDAEYPGHDKEITSIINSFFPELKIHINAIGKKSLALFAAYGAYINKRNLDVKLNQDDLFKVIKTKRNSPRTVTQLDKSQSIRSPHRLSLTSSIVKNDILSSVREWTKVIYLKEGQRIAVKNENGEVIWDTITKIEHLPSEQVYDIEVEGTHNFIGNDIVAHNTYITGGLGVGTVENTNGNITGTGALTVRSGTATSTFSTGGLTVGTNQFVVQQTSGNVGIGTTGPVYSFDIQKVNNADTGTSPATGALSFRLANVNTTANNNIAMGFGDSSNSIAASIWTKIIDHSNEYGELYFGTRGVGNTFANTLMLNSVGNVGIGTTTPNWLLQANGTRPFFTLSDSSAGTNLRHWFMSSQGGNFYVGTSSDAYSTSTVSALTILSNSNIGVGTTSPFAKFSVSGNLAADNLTITATNATSTFNGGLLGATGGGVIGFGTTTPSTFFSVAGHCVTGDTRLRRRRKRVKSQKSKIKSQNSEDDYIYDEVQIKDIKPGDEILTLNEKTGKLEYRGVRSLLDMGIERTFVLFTETGKKIRTTANHPYFAKQHIVISGVFEADQSNRIEELNKPTYIAIANDDFSDTIVLDKKIKKELYDFYKSKNKIKFFAPAVWARSLAYLIRKNNIGNARIILDKEYSGYEPLITEIIKQYTNNIDINFDIIGKKSPAHFAAYGANIAVKNKKSTEAPVARIAKGDLHPETSSEIRPPFGRLNISYTREFNLSRGKWTKTMYLNIGAEIMTIDGWDKIIKIQRVAKEQVYDIEVEGTHNFIGNDIVAHNTYITGGLGVGTVENTNGNITGTGALTINSTTATSTFSTGGLTVGTSQFVVQQTSGNVGIGTTNPSDLLTVNAPTTATFGLRITDTSDALTFTHNVTNSVINANNNNLSVGAGDTGTGNQDAILFNKGSHYVAINTANSEKVRIDTNGKVGIGTTTPNWMLQANGTRPFFTLSDSSAGTNLRHWFMSSQGGNFYVGTSSDAYSTSTVSALTILSNSNIGVGTTSPFAKFSVSGNLAADNLTITATNATSTFNGGLLGAAGGGVIGFGTTTPSTFFSVAGHCVTGDTRLRRRRRKKKANGEYEYEYDEVQIKDIKPGDEILTLNEKTGKLEYRGVRSLLDMGTMPIYKLTTASGKTIRTTGNHPYLTRNEIKTNSVAFIDYANMKAWARDKGLIIDMQVLIEMLKSIGVNEIRFYYGYDERNLNINSFFSKLVRLGYIVKTKPVQYFKILLSDLLQKEANARWLKSISPLSREDLKKEAFVLDKKGIELFALKANFDVEISVDALVMSERYDNFLLFSGDGDFGYLTKALRQNYKKIIAVSGRKHLSGVLAEETNKFITMERILKILPELVFKQGAENSLNAKPALRQVLKKCNSSIAALFNLSNISCVDNKNGTWRKVADIREGQEIAAVSKGAKEVIWDTITKIEHLSSEQVYDIEVEGTHNFIAGHYINTKTGESLTTEQEEIYATIKNLELKTKETSFEEDSFVTINLSANHKSSPEFNNSIANQNNMSNDVVDKNNNGSVWSGRDSNPQVSGDDLNSLPINLPPRSGAVNSLYNAVDLIQILKNELQIPLEDIEFGGIVAHNTYITGGLGVGTVENTNGNITGTGALTVRSGTATSTFSTGGLTVGTSQFVVQQTSGNVGIGTTSPSSLLEIQKNASGQQWLMTLRNSTAKTLTSAVRDGITFIGRYTGQTTDTSVANINYGLTDTYQNGGGTLGFEVINTGGGWGQVMTLKGSGNVGIGTTSPMSKLSVDGDGITVARTTDSWIRLMEKVTGQNYYLNTNATGGFQVIDGSVSNAVRMTIKNSTGNVGIGTTTPNWLLQANGTRPFFTLSDSSAGTNLRHWFMSSQGGNFYVGTSSDAYSTSTVSALTILSNSNIGVGTTSPFAKFSVSGNLAADNLTITATNATSTFNGGLLGAAGGGVIGFGTTTPSTFFSVAGHCVTGDTRLKRVKRKKKKKNGEYEYEFEDTRIDEIKAGDEILTLDDKTGKLKVSRVNKLMDMGVKEIFELVTEDGKKIRTTAEHPYFVKMSSPELPKKKPKLGIFFDNANMFYAQKKAGWKIDFAKLKQELSKSFDLKFINFYTAIPEEEDESMKKTLKYLSFIEPFVNLITKPLKYIKIKKLIGEKIVETVKKKGDMDVELTLDVAKLIDNIDVLLIASGDSDLLPLKNYALESGKKIVFVGFQNNMAWELRQILHIPLDDYRNVLDLELNEINMNKKQAPSFGLGVALLNTLYSRAPSLSSGGVWKKVAELKAAQKIAVIDKNQKPVWSAITKINRLPSEQVYDIEVEGTHNFIGNDIVAHNTYITGGLGVGTVENTNGNITGTGALTINSTTATSTFSTGGLTVGTNQFVVQQTSGNVGIGTTTPNWLLQANGTRPFFTLSDSSAAANLKHWFLSSQGGNLYVGTSSDAYSTSTVSALTILSNSTVGIGTTTPFEKFAVQGGLGADYLTITGASNATSTFSTGGLTVGTNQFVVQQTSGNVGIGKNNPGIPLDVYGASVSSVMTKFTPSNDVRNALAVYNAAASGGYYLQFGVYQSSNTYYAGANSSFVIGENGLSLLAAGATPIIFATNANLNTGVNERARIDSAGNFGIGTTTPNWLLQANGARPFFTLSDSSAGTNLRHWFMSSQGGNFYVGTSSDAYSTSTVSALTINSNGKIGINTQPTETAQIIATTTLSNATGNDSAYELNYTVNKLTSGNDTGLLINRTDVSSPGTSYIADFRNGGSSVFRIESGGVVEVASTIRRTTNGASLTLIGMKGATNAGTHIDITTNGSKTNTSGTNIITGITPMYNQTSGTGANTDLFVQRMELAIGSGSQYLLDLQSGNGIATTSRFNVTNIGKVGVGTTTPFWNMQISTTTPFFTLSDSSAVANLKHWFLSSQGGNLYVGTSSDTYATTSISAFMISKNGNVGIGTTTPNARLSIEGPCGDNDTTGGCVDIAELYNTSEPVEQGEIVAVNENNQDTRYNNQTNSNNQISIFKENPMVKKASQGDTVIGIVSSNPAMTIEGSGLQFLAGTRYEHNTMKPAVALAGRVPVKVSLEGGEIMLGDRIALSSVPGVGMKATSSGITVGVALENFNGENSTTTISAGQDFKTGKILVFVNLGYSKLDIAANDLGKALIVDSESGKIKASYSLDLDNKDILNVRNILAKSGKWSLDENGKLIVEKIETEKIEVKNPYGITIYDTETGEPMCVVSENRTLKSIPGKCEDLENNQPQAENNQTPIDNNKINSNNQTENPAISSGVSADSTVVRQSELVNSLSIGDLNNLSNEDKNTMEVPGIEPGSPELTSSDSQPATPTADSLYQNPNSAQTENSERENSNPPAEIIETAETKEETVQAEQPPQIENLESGTADN